MSDHLEARQQHEAEIGRLKRRIACLERELTCYRELLPGKMFVSNGEFTGLVDATVDPVWDAIWGEP